MLLGDLTVAFGADLSGLQSGMSGAASILNNIGGLFGPVGTATANFMNQATDAAAGYQTSLLKVQAYAGLSQQATDAMSRSILQMSTNVGVGPKELADALYPIISSGYSASQALTILSLSAKTAAASGAQTSVVADVLTTSLGAMHEPASQAANYMDMMNQMVSLGKGEMPQYAAVLGKLSLAAGSANVPFATMGAALSTLTTHGFPSVAQASTSLGNLFTQIGPKVDAVAAHAKKLGLSFDETAFKSMSLGDKIAYLNQVTDGNQGEILKLLGGSTLAQKAFNSLSGSANAYSSNLAAMNNAQGKTAQVFATASDGYNFQVKRQNAAFQALQVTIGSQMLPAMTAMTMWETNAIIGITNWIASTGIITQAITGLSNIITSKVVPAMTFLGGIATTLFQAALPSIQQYASAMQNGLGAALSVTQTKFSQFDTYLNGTALPAMHTYATSVIAEYQKINDYVLKTYVPAMQKVGVTISQQSSTSSVSKDVSTASASFDKLVTSINKMIDTGQKLVQQFLQPFEDYWNNKIMPAVHDAQPGWEHLSKSIGDLVIALSPLFPGGKTNVADLGDTIANLIPNLIRLSGVISDNLASALDIFNPTIAAAITNLQDFGQNISDRLPQSTKDGFGLILQSSFGFLIDWKKNLSAIWTAASQIFTLGANLIEGQVLIWIDVINGNWTQALMDVQSTWGQFITNLTTMWNTFVQWIRDALGPKLVTEAGQSLIDTVHTIMNAVGAVWNPIANMINHTMGGNVGLFPTYASGGDSNPHYASGTSNHPGGLAWVGENGPELVNLPGGSQVYPNGSGPSGSGGAQYITILLDSNVLARAIGQKQQKMIYLQTGVK